MEGNGTEKQCEEKEGKGKKTKGMGNKRREKGSTGFLPNADYGSIDTVGRHRRLAATSSAASASDYQTVMFYLSVNENCGPWRYALTSHF